MVKSPKSLRRIILIELVLPTATLIIAYTILGMFNGQKIDSNFQKGLSQMIGIGSFLLIILIIKGSITVFKSTMTTMVKTSIPSSEPSGYMRNKGNPNQLVNSFWNKKLLQKFTWNKKTQKYILILLSVILFICALANPSYERFKEFTPYRATTKHYALRQRLHNYIIYSTYVVKYTDIIKDDEGIESTQQDSAKFIGILQNFYAK